MLKHSKTTESLITSLSKIKEDRKQMAEKLKQNILKNTEIYEQHTLSTRKSKLGVLVSREKSIEVLEKKLYHKIKNDDLNNVKLATVQQEAGRRRREIEKKIEEINNRNSQRIRELKEIEEKVIRKIQGDFEKSQNKERHLRSEYTRIKNEERRVSETKIYQKKESYEQWRLLQSEKWRLEGIVKEHEERQNVLIVEKNPIPVKVEPKKKKEQKYIPTQKEYNKLRPAKIDAKQMGKQYLEQAKQMHREQANKKNKKKLMNLNLKVIGYSSDIMEKIYRNTSDLSNFYVLAKPQKNQIEEQPLKQIEQEKEAVHITNQQVKFQFKLSDDLQTERYLKQIKSHLSQLSQIHNSKENPEEIPTATTNIQQSSIMPVTLK